MARVFERALAPGPVARAFVIGVGAYPSAKPANIALDGTTPVQLQNVPDLLSAGTGAALFTDWLIENADALAAPLASIDLLLNLNTTAGLISDYSWAGRVGGPANGIDPRPDTGVGSPTTAQIKQAGTAWKSDLCQGTGNVAIFYICGHGALLGSDNVVFLSDLNADTANPWGALLNVQTHASAFKVLPTIETAFFFVDACSELVTDIQLTNPGVGAQFATSGGKLGTEKVTVLSAAAPKRLSYEGALAGQPAIKAGRFTQLLLQGLRGAAVRQAPNNGQWSINGTSLFESLKQLYRLRPDWADLPFDPNPPMLPADRYEIVSYATAPTVPFLIRFVPPRAGQWALEIRDYQNMPVATRPLGPPVDWFPEATASLFPYVLSGTSDAESKQMHLSTLQSIFCYDL